MVLGLPQRCKALILDLSLKNWPQTLLHNAGRLGPIEVVDSSSGGYISTVYADSGVYIALSPETEF